MTDPVSQAPEEIPPALVEERSGWSVVWLIPIVAVVVGGWLAYRAIMEKGPEITIVFESAAGLEAGKTKVKYKDVEVGEVTDVRFNEDLSKVLVTAELQPSMRDHLREGTRFWVVTARLAAGQVSGLSTLLSGAYIAMDPTGTGRPQRSFVGLNKPPVITGRTPGTRYRLEAESLGSIEAGSPIYYRKIRVGQVESYELREDGSGIVFGIFIRAPYDRLVHENTRFWNASGIEVSLNAEGFRLRTESLVSMLIGGIAFDTPENLERSGPAKPGTLFRLYSSREETTRPEYQRKERYLIYFTDSVRGLKVGAPVLIRGIEVGKVVDVKFEFDVDTLDFRVPVLIEIEPDRVQLTGSGDKGPGRAFDEELVAGGLRAQLSTGNLLTGQLLIELEMHPEVPPGKLRVEHGYKVIPSIPGEIDRFKQGLLGVLQKIQRLPLDQIAENLNATLAGTNRIANSPELLQALEHLNATLAETQTVADDLSTKTLPRLEAVLQEAHRTLNDLGGLVRSDSPLYQELMVMVKELSASARSIRMMSSYLEQHPEALLKGKRP